MAYDPKVIDLSTYLAWFCLAEDTWEQREEIFKTIMKAYGDHHLLSEEEIASIKPLVRASYAAYFQKTSELIYDGDQSAETVDWNVKSRTLLKLSANW